MFAQLLRTAACLPWLFILARRRPLSPVAASVVVGTLAVLIATIAVGGWVSGLHVVDGSLVRTFYTGTAVVVLAAGVAVAT